MKRLFAAIKIEPNREFAWILNQIRTDLRHEKIKWVELSNVHITLKFFGETDEAKIPAIKNALQVAASGSKAFDLKINRTGIFGSRYDPKVIWFGIDPDPMLTSLAHLTFEELRKCGWEPDRQNFVPHLTIGRIRDLRDKGLFQQIIDNYKEAGIQTQRVDKIILYESILRPQGPVYVNLANFQLI